MKHLWRKEIQQALRTMPPELAAEKSHRACAAITGLPEFRQARVVMVYLPMRSEVDTVPIALAAWQDEKTVLAPKVSWEQRHMIALECRSLDDELVLAPHGVREPVGGEPWPVDEIDFIVVPAIAFDRRAHRLGRGGGFYDRFLAQEGVRAVKCGLGYHEQVVDELPVHPHDHPIDILVTDREVLRFPPRGQRQRPGPDVRRRNS